jgi:ketosteroid isomerase-like protein
LNVGVRPGGAKDTGGRDTAPVPKNSLLLTEVFADGFPVGEDAVAAMSDQARIERLGQALERVAGEDLVVEMVADESFRRERFGLDGFLEAWNDWLEPFEVFHVELEDMLDVGENVVTLVKQSGLPKGGATEIENEGAAIWSFKDGKLVRVEFHLNREVALRALGLDPDSA